MKTASHTKTKNFLTLSLLASTMLLNGCATMALMDKTQASEPDIKTTQILAEDVIAIGYPSNPVKGYENAMVLAGKNYSFLVQPVVSDDTPRDMFKQIFSKVDLEHLYIDTKNGYKTVENKTQQQSNTLPIKVSYMTLEYFKTQNLKNHPINIGLIFVKPMGDVSKDERAYLEGLSFKCETAPIQDIDSLICSRSIKTELTVATAVSNINNVKHRLKQPLKIVINHVETTPGKDSWVRLPLMPVTLAVDLVTLPIQAVGAAIGVGLLSMALN